jgi:xanthine dehydrogenase small subunit
LIGPLFASRCGVDGAIDFMTNQTSGEPRRAVRFVFRGKPVELAGFSPRATLLDWLRQEARATGTKEGCGEGDCGACTVVLARTTPGGLVHEPVNACILLLGQVDGAELITVEDLAAGGEPHVIQEALVRHHGSQCGFCTPGIVMSLFALHQDGARPITRDQLNDQLAGNLCRCTGYRPIIDAALEASALPADDAFTDRAAARIEAIQSVADELDVFVGDEASFFAAPASQDALAQLYLAHPDALILAGATDVGLWITKGLQDPRKIIWLGRVAGLDAIEDRGDVIRLGAGVTHAAAFASLNALSPDLGEIVRRFGSVQVRASGTVGGSIANGSPIGDLAPCLIALGATLELRRGDDVRRLPLEDFFLAYRKQDRLPSEFVSAIEIPRPKADHVFRAYKVTKRFDEDISAVLGAFSFRLENRRVSEARIAYGGMAGTPARARNAEGFAIGIRLDDESTWRGALQALALDYQPLSDMRASATYRSLVARNLLLKALMELRGAPVSETRLVAPREVSHAAE